jgi:acetolactate synthase-1/2/3 large subunit
MIVISGQVPTDQLSAGTGCRQIGQQEFNIAKTVKTMTKYSVTLMNKESILYCLEKAYTIAVTGRPGPVWIDIPLDIQAAEINDDFLVSYTHPSFQNIYSYKNKLKLIKFKKLLYNSKKPVIVIGNGIKSSGTKQELFDFLFRIQAPIMSGPHSAVDIVPSDVSQYSGRFGLLGHVSSNKIIQESDLVISLGSRLNPKMIGYDSKNFAPKAVKIVIDVDKYELKKLKFDKCLKWRIGLKEFFELTRDVCFYPDRKWGIYVKEERDKEVYVKQKHLDLTGSVSTYAFCKELQVRLSYDSIIVTSNGTAHVVPMKTIELKNRQQMFSNEGTAPMGYGLPAAIGAHYGSRFPVICIEGDGSIMMNLQELETIKYNDLPIKIFILNNEGYLSIRQTQNSFFGGRISGASLQTGVSIPSFKKIANAFGYEYFAIRTNKDIGKILDKVLWRKRCIVEVFSDPDELHEPRVRAKGIDESGKIIPGELTDIR